MIFCPISLSPITMISTDTTSSFLGAWSIGSLLPGAYTVSVTHPFWCWKESEREVTLETDSVIPAFEQSGKTGMAKKQTIICTNSSLKFKENGNWYGSSRNLRVSTKPNLTFPKFKNIFFCRISVDGRCLPCNPPQLLNREPGEE